MTDDLYITEELFGTGRTGAGDTAVVSEDDVRSRSGGPLGSLRTLDLRETTVRITWTGPNGERSFVIATFEGPAV